MINLAGTKPPVLWGPGGKLPEAVMLQAMSTAGLDCSPAPSKHWEQRAGGVRPTGGSTEAMLNVPRVQAMLAPWRHPWLLLPRDPFLSPLLPWA